MFNATDGTTLPTSVIGSLPRPAWYRENLGTRRSFRTAMVSTSFREQYTDSGVVLHPRSGNGGSRHRDRWRCPVRRRRGRAQLVLVPAAPAVPAGLAAHSTFAADEDRSGLAVHGAKSSTEVSRQGVVPDMVGAGGIGELEYARWKTAQPVHRQTVKFGSAPSCSFAMRDLPLRRCPRECIWAFRRRVERRPPVTQQVVG